MRARTPYFQSRIASRYLKTFFVYKPLWEAIDDVKKEEFIREWNKPIT